ncbi:hypothetical protein P167DRAFT_579827 [Morchella conica CCBAS932]|uniref:Uncharacterized protein n=1 Tax=Morchella conica CCBAS932 TaxID=1392247 RepID=A0A3N4KBT6_9PEZI|nr:hypothetical protein P167DRAFT_579827 [Morchella conica CCBAS932]
MLMHYREHVEGFGIIPQYSSDISKFSHRNNLISKLRYFPGRRAPVLARSLRPERLAPPGSTFHAWRALANALFARHRSWISPASREHPPMLTSPSPFGEYYSPPRAIASALSTPSVDITHLRKALANALFARLR